MQFSEYLADTTAVSKSWLDQIDRSPAHLRYYLDHPEDRKRTKTLDLGRLVHALVLEPDEAIKRYAVIPKGLKKPTAAQINAKNPTQKTLDQINKWDDFTLRIGDAEIVTQESMTQALAMRDSVFANPEAKKILSAGEPEVTHFWTDPETGILCKARADSRDTEQSLGADLKITRNGSPKAFMRSIIDYRYDVQAAHYMRGFELNRFKIIAVEELPPYAVAVYDVTDEVFQRGDYMRSKNLNLYAECKANNYWPGYSDISIPLELPAWAQV